MFADFLPTAGDAIVNQLPKYRYMSGGQCTVPVTVRVDRRRRPGASARSTSAPARAGSWHLPGLRVVDGVARPGAAYELLRAAIRNDDPVLFYEHKALYARKGPVERGDDRRDRQGRTSARRARDVTIVATLLMVERALAAAEALAADGIDAEVIDLRWLRPLDLADRRGHRSSKTGRLVVAEEQVHAGGWGATVICELTMRRHPWTAPPRRGQPARRPADPVQPAARGRGHAVGGRDRRRRTARGDDHADR